MICFQLTLLFLLLWKGSTQEPEPVFRPVGSVVELGYCFGEDYIVVYKVAREGDKLLGNSSAESQPVTLPLDFKGRVRTSQNSQLLGLQISNLSQRDSGNYRRECWKNQTLVKQYMQQLIVCDSEFESQEITVKPEVDRVEILCNNSAIGQEGVSVRWYRDIFPSYTITPLLDSRISLELVDGILEIKNNGAELVLNKSMLSNNQHFYCLVVKDAHCLSFQDLYMPEGLESRDIFASHGDKVVLYCKADGNDQYWDTPTGRVDNTDERSHHMFISTSEEHYSLVIHTASEEHFGDYSCVSTTSEMQYSLVSCPRRDKLEIFTFEKHEVTLKCDIGKVDSYMVQWYRRQASGQQELICDSGDESVPLPEDLRGRVKLWDDDTALTISHVERADEELYWCVVIKGAVILEDDEYIEEYDEEDEEGEGNLNTDWEDKCLFKQEIFVSVRELSTKGQVTPQRPEPPQPKKAGQERTGALVELVIISIAAMFVL